jgi:hypothetical protein
VTQIPRAEPGSKCPLWRCDVSKVCHTCTLWRPLVVGKKSDDGRFTETHDRWACVFLHQATVSVDILASIDGLQRAMESFRNTSWSESQKNLSDIIDSVRQQSTALNNVADAVDRLPGKRMAEIEHQ